MNVVINSRTLIQDIEQLAYETEKHFHNREIWFGNGGVIDSLTPYTLVSGNGDYGAEVLLLDTINTPVIAGNKYYDPHEIFVTNSSSVNPYFIKLIWGESTVAAAETANQFSVLPFEKIISTGNANGSVASIMTRRVNSGKCKVWAKCKNATNLATVEIYVGIHEYFR